MRPLICHNGKHVIADCHRGSGSGRGLWVGGEVFGRGSTRGLGAGGGFIGDGFQRTVNLGGGHFYRCLLSSSDYPRKLILLQKTSEVTCT